VTDFSATYTAVQIRDNRDIVVSYHDPFTFDLKVSICREGFCLVPTQVTIDNNGTVGLYNDLKLDANGLAVISYYDETYGNLKLAYCQDLECTKVNITRLDGAGNVGLFTALQLNSQGAPVVSYIDQTNAKVKVALCDDADCLSPTFHEVDSLSNAGNYTDLQLDDNDFPLVSYVDLADFSLKLAVCSATNCSTKTIVTIDDTTKVGPFTSLQRNFWGHPLLGYYDESNQTVKLALCQDVACGSMVYAFVDNSTASTGLYISLRFNTITRYPMASYYDASNGDLKVMACQDKRCTSSTLSIVDHVGDVGQYVDLTINPRGYPLISYSTNSSELRLALCNDFTCYDPVENLLITTVDASGDVGLSTSLQLNGEGYAVISYGDQSSDTLKLAVCNDELCTAPVINIIDTFLNFGFEFLTCLALDKHDHPRIAYCGGGHNLKLAYCHDPTCMSFNFTVVASQCLYCSIKLNNESFPRIGFHNGAQNNLELAICHDPICGSVTLRTLDGQGPSTTDAGEYTSLELDEEGHVWISYYDRENHALKMVACGDVNCTNATLVTVDDQGGEHNSMRLSS
jgi:hypothetical protein